MALICTLTGLRFGLKRDATRRCPGGSCSSGLPVTCADILRRCAAASCKTASGGGGHALSYKTNKKKEEKVKKEEKKKRQENLHNLQQQLTY